ncbi:sodium:solute symporter family protein [Paenibacillus sp. DMB20]|uniref:sodium:solute symporter family protein n=1 Tax=Paenibacillus sp. DMB20 TaxID=1642570 RepID=UPI001F1DFEF5|nr:sodium:solute symporter family protein [Paenibacillus sp. DMB20]
MKWADLIVIGFYILLVMGATYWSLKQVKNSNDFFAAGGKLPWWLSGVSHHMSGYSAAVFVAYAAVAYNYGFTMYVWWAVPIAIGVFAGSFLFAPRWARLRRRLNIESPMEYLSIRYNVPTQQMMAWSGVLLKVFDVGAKWAAIAVILNVFTGLDIMTGIFISGAVGLFYTAIGGLWADALNDFGQFIVQLLAAAAMIVAVASRLGGFGELLTMWDRLPAEHSMPLREPYTLGFVLAYLLIYTFSYNGGTWNLAQRFIASPRGKDARKAAVLSSILYLVWPLFIFYPMWAAPILFPGLEDPTKSYSIMATELLPHGLIGLVLIAMFTQTLAMTSSDANAITAVVTRDILPVMFPKKFQKNRTSLFAVRLTVLIFILVTVMIALNAKSFGGVLDLLIIWFGGLVGPISIPMLLGLLPWFRRSGSAAAITSWCAGIAAFILVKFVIPDLSTAAVVAAPVLTSLVIYAGMGWLNPNKVVRAEVDELLDALNRDDDDDYAPVPPKGAVTDAG